MERKGPILAAFIALTFCCVQAVYSQADENAVIDRHISSREKSGDCDEYTEGRKTLRGDVNGDGSADVVVLFTLEGCGGGGNNSAQWLAVFVRKGKKIQYTAEDGIGSTTDRSVELVSIVGGKINLNTLSYRPNDAACCPSRKGKTKYVFANRKLRELK